jgi:uncharacterized membrane protein YgcG
MPSTSSAKVLHTEREIRYVLCEVRCAVSTMDSAMSLPLSLRVNGQLQVQVVDAMRNVVATCPSDSSDLLSVWLTRPDVKIIVSTADNESINCKIYCVEESINELLDLVNHKKTNRVDKPSYVFRHVTRYRTAEEITKAQAQAKKAAEKRSIVDLTAVDNGSPVAVWPSGPSDVVDLTMSPPLRKTSAERKQSAQATNTTPAERNASANDVGTPISIYSVSSAEVPPVGNQYLGTLKTCIVGVSFYSGEAFEDEVVVLERDPYTEHDFNAIAVNTTVGERLGHIPRNIASDLALLLDNDSIICTAWATSEANSRSQKIDVMIYRQASANDSVEYLLGLLNDIEGFREGKRGKKRKKMTSRQAFIAPVRSILSDADLENDMMLGTFECKARLSDFKSLQKAAYAIQLQVKYKSNWEYLAVQDERGIEVAALSHEAREKLLPLVKAGQIHCLCAPVGNMKDMTQNVKVVVLAKREMYSQVFGLQNAFKKWKIFRPLMSQSSLSTLVQELDLSESPIESGGSNAVRLILSSFGNGSGSGHPGYGNGNGFGGSGGFGGGGGAGAGAGAGSEIIETETYISTMDWETQQKELDAMFDQVHKDQMADVPEYPLSPYLKGVKLYDYQIDGIRWLMHQERSDKLPPFFKRMPNRGWFCEITQCILAEKPAAMKGCILADDMGLGKVSMDCTMLVVVMMCLYVLTVLILLIVLAV